MSMTATLSGGFVSFGKDNVTVKVSLQGATVISYTKDGREILFTSAK
jgi:D-hexose-6-phosphate mutarotase